MLPMVLFSIVVAAVVHALVNQVPLPSHQSPPSLSDDGPTSWTLNDSPNPNATDHLVFETVHSLLQHWPNTRMRNGHNIVPGIIPKGTLLYHGRQDEQLPPGPEWIAFDPEYSYLYCRNVLDRPRGGWHLTLMTSRPLRVIYFDGSSAAKFPFGSMDTQDLITWGRPGTGEKMYEEEAQRIHDLCEWGKNIGVDVFVRMQIDFEAMLCNFSSGVRVASFDHLASKWTHLSGFSSTEMFETANAASWHNRFPGETRVQLDLPGLVSFYDTQLAPSLVPIRAGQGRWDHRAINVSAEDLSAAKSMLEANLMRPYDASSGIDWKTLIQVIVDRYSQRLELTRYLLESPATHPDDIIQLAKKAQTQLRIMLTPYLLYSASPPDRSDRTDSDWTIPVYKLCATTHTHSMESQFMLATHSEELLLRAVRGTTREICRVVTKMWSAGVYAGLDPSLNTKALPDIAEVTRLRETWAQELKSLMSWLDWSVWVKCTPACGAEEICYLPAWPLGFPWVATEPPVAHFPIDDDDKTDSSFQTMENPLNEVPHAMKPEKDEWIRPQPKCIRRIKPYTF